jgi:heme exporter protein C
MKTTQPLFLLLMAAATLYSFLTPPAAGFREPELARIIFFHVPCALTSLILLIWAAWCGGVSLKTKKPIWDQRLAASLEVGLVFALLALATGIVFSRVQWGDWWHWDPRQTSFLMVNLLAGGAVTLRMAISDEAKRASASAAYALGMVVPAVFLTYVYPRLEAVRQQSMHPTQVMGGSEGLDTWHRIGVYGTLLLMGALAFTLYRLRTRVGMAEWEAMQDDGSDETGGSGSSADGVVRPVALSQKP